MKEILQKLGSRKFQAFLAVIITAIGTLVGMPENKTAVIVALVGAALSAIAYIFAEASIDKAAVGLNQPGVSEDEVEETLHELSVALNARAAEKYGGEEDGDA